MLSKYEEGISFDKIKRYALAPGGKGGTSWKHTPIFCLVMKMDFGEASCCQRYSRSDNAMIYRHLWPQEMDDESYARRQKT